MLSFLKFIFGLILLLFSVLFAGFIVDLFLDFICKLGDKIKEKRK